MRCDRCRVIIKIFKKIFIWEILLKFDSVYSICFDLIMNLIPKTVVCFVYIKYITTLLHKITLEQKCRISKSKRMRKFEYLIKCQMNS